jgi:hypothetical protein
MYFLVNEVSGVKGFGDGVKVGVKRDEGRCKVGGDVGGRAHNEVIGEGEELESNKLDKVKIVRELPNDVTGVHWKGLGEFVLLLICSCYLGGVTKILFWDPFITGRRIADPRYEIVSSFTRSFMSKDGLNFVFLFFGDNVRWWFLEVRAMHVSFAIG